jgi:hypothetical protein
VLWLTLLSCPSSAPEARRLRKNSPARMSCPGVSFGENGENPMQILGIGRVRQQKPCDDRCGLSEVYAGRNDPGSANQTNTAENISPHRSQHKVVTFMWHFYQRATVRTRFRSMVVSSLKNGKPHAACSAGQGSPSCVDRRRVCDLPEAFTVPNSVARRRWRIAGPLRTLVVCVICDSA